MADLLVYPDPLPCPQSAPYQRAERRVASPLPSKRLARALWRDRLGTVPVEFMFTFAEVAIWRDWIANKLLEGGAWFAAPWRLPSGRSGVYRFVETPSYPEYLPPVGWRVSGLLEVRGRGMPPRGHAFPWEPVLRDGTFRYSLVDDFNIADPDFDETTLTLAQGTFGDVNPHPVNGPSWPVNTITPPPDTGDVIWVRKTTNLTDFISTWHVHIVNDNDVRIWFNGVEVFGSLGGGGFDTTLDVTPVLGDNVLAIRVIETLGATPFNHSQAGFEITR